MTELLIAENSPPSRTYKAHAKNDPDLEKAIIFFNESKYSEAISLLEKICLRKPKDITALKLLAVSYQKSGNFQKAIERFEKVVKLEPRNPENYFVLGMLLLETGKYKPAAKNFERAVELKPGEVKYRKALSRTCYSIAYDMYSSYQMGRVEWTKMIGLLEKAVRLDATNTQAHLLLGNINEMIGDIWDGRAKNLSLSKATRNDASKEAKTSYDEAYKAYFNAYNYGEREDALFFLARVCYKQEKPDLSQQYLKKHLADHPEDERALELQKKINSK